MALRPTNISSCQLHKSSCQLDILTSQLDILSSHHNCDNIIERAEKTFYISINVFNYVFKETFSRISTQAGIVVVSLHKPSRPVVDKLSPAIALKFLIVKYCLCYGCSGSGLDYYCANVADSEPTLN